MSKTDGYYETQIVHKRDHYEVYVDGMFICSADTVVEAAKELDRYFEKNRGVSA